MAGRRMNGEGSHDYMVKRPPTNHSGVWITALRLPRPRSALVDSALNRLCLEAASRPNDSVSSCRHEASKTGVVTPMK
jgi:hypothetical protein